jgi:hypothetical protein
MKKSMKLVSILIIFVFLLSINLVHAKHIERVNTENQTTVQRYDQEFLEQMEKKVDNSQTFSITKATREDFIKAKNRYKDKLIRDTLNIRKVNGIIEIPMARPGYFSSVIFKDTLLDTDDSGIREYHYLGYFPDIECYLVSGTFWEYYECYLIDKNSGYRTTTWNRPFLSPNAKYFANLSMPYGLEGVPNGIQIWKVGDDCNDFDYLSKYLELDQQIWVPDEFYWETDNSLILKVVPIDQFWDENGSPNQNDFYYLRIRL